MKKHTSKNSQTDQSRLRPLAFLGIAILSAVICIFALRANNEHMISLRDNVFIADKNNTDVTGALRNLQQYVTTHMNTNLSSGNGSVYPPIQLKYTYERLVSAESQNVDTAKTQLYTSAQVYCQQQDPVDFSGRNRVPCIEKYVQTHSVTSQTIPASLYEFSFTSPLWSPDLAGLSMATAAAGGLAFIFIIVRRYLKT